MVEANDSTRYLAGRAVPAEKLEAWVETFHREGYLFLENVLPPDWCAELRDDLERALRDNPNGLNSVSDRIRLSHRLFESSPANLRLFDLEPIVSLAEALIAPTCHVIHNNSFQSPPGGGITSWHQDDPAHYLVTHGEPPTNVRLPVLFFSANYYLTDVTGVEHGGTEVIPGSHLFGATPPTELEGTPVGTPDPVQPRQGRAAWCCSTTRCGTGVDPTAATRTRYITQVTYARRIIGHKYYPFMNYTMPEHVYADADPRLRRLLGFLPHGAYG